MKRQRWGLLGGGCATLFLALLVAGMLGWQYVSYVPPVPPPPQATMPVPNARDDFIAAGKLLTGGSTTRSSRRSSAMPVPLPELHQAVAADAPALQRLRVGLCREYANLPILSNTQGFPEMAQFRELARALAREAELAQREGRSKDALRSGLDAVKMGQMCQRHGALIHGLAAVAYSAIGLQTVEEVLETADAETAASAARELWNLDREAPGYADLLTTERDTSLFLVATLCRASDPKVAIQEITGNTAAPTPSEMGLLFQFAITPKRKILENSRRYMDAMIARARKPYYARGPQPSLPSDPINQLVAPVFDSANIFWEKEQAYRRLLATRLAVRAYTLRQGHVPAKLTDLVPAYLPAVPQDPFAPAPLRYRVENSKAVIYSQGPDGDDDGGQDLGNQVQPTSNGDLASTRRAGKR